MAELTGHVAGYPGGTSVVFTTPLPLRPGTRAKDVDGNEYVFCTFANPCNAKMTVTINSVFDAGTLLVTGRGPIGVVCASEHTSDTAGWVQIYGRCTMQIADAGSGGTQPSPSDAAAGPTTLGTSAQSRFLLGTSLTSPNALQILNGTVSTTSGIFAEGITTAEDMDATAVTAVCNTTAASARHTGAQVLVVLNYPQLVHRNYGE